MLIAPKWWKLRTSNLAGISRPSLGHARQISEVWQRHKNVVKLMLCKNSLGGDMHAHEHLVVVLSVRRYIRSLVTLTLRWSTSRGRLILTQKARTTTSRRLWTSDAWLMMTMPMIILPISVCCFLVIFYQCHLTLKCYCSVSSHSYYCMQYDRLLPSYCQCHHSQIWLCASDSTQQSTTVRDTNKLFLLY